MSALTDWMLDLVYPTKCVLCRRKLPPGRPSICPACLAVMPRADGVWTKGDGFNLCVSALHYEGDVKKAIQRYKFANAQCYRHAFGELVAARIYEDLDGEYDILSFVPLAPDRLRERGYDQVLLLAEIVSARLQKPCVRLLKKRRGVGAQSLTMGIEERRRNIAGAYTAIDPAQIAGNRILLIDDIVTTGSTLSECAKTLKGAGAKDVVCATLAVAD